jgi:hypothetical protein
MTRALRHPALLTAAGVGAFLALTWPLLVFDRPLYVVGSFFAIWIGVIGLLFAISAAQNGDAEGDAAEENFEEDVDARD